MNVLMGITLFAGITLYNLILGLKMVSCWTAITFPVVTIPVCFFIKSIFLKYNLFDCPDGKLKLQQNPIPFSGGASIAVLLCFLILCSAVLKNFFLTPASGLRPTDLVNLFFLPLAFVFPFNFLDDVYRFSPGRLFVSQVIFSLLSVAVFCPYSGIFTQCLSFMFVLSLLNAINLVDVADGLCITMAISAFLGLAYIFPVAGLKVISLVFANILAGLFLFNSPEASIYLGNSGSGLLGACFSVLILKYLDFSSARTFFTVTTIFGLFFAELCGLILVRLALGLKPYQGSPHHFNSFLKHQGWDKWRVLSISASTSGLLNVVAWLLFNQSIGLEPYFLILVLSLWLWVTIVYWPIVKRS